MSYKLSSSHWIFLTSFTHEVLLYHNVRLPVCGASGGERQRQGWGRFGGGWGGVRQRRRGAATARKLRDFMHIHSSRFHLSCEPKCRDVKRKEICIRVHTAGVFFLFFVPPVEKRKEWMSHLMEHRMGEGGKLLKRAGQESLMGGWILNQSQTTTNARRRTRRMHQNGSVINVEAPRLEKPCRRSESHLAKKQLLEVFYSPTRSTSVLAKSKPEALSLECRTRLAAASSQKGSSCLQVGAQSQTVRGR